MSSNTNSPEFVNEQIGRGASPSNRRPPSDEHETSERKTPSSTTPHATSLSLSAGSSAAEQNFSRAPANVSCVPSKVLRNTSGGSGGSSRQGDDANRRASYEEEEDQTPSTKNERGSSEPPRGRPTRLRVAVIGAGFTGLRLAERFKQMSNLLLEDGRRLPSIEVVVLEKSMGYGGRLATRYTKGPDPEGYQFDIGAPFFRAKSGQFKKYLEEQLGLNSGTPDCGWEPRTALVVPGKQDPLTMISENAVEKLALREASANVREVSTARGGSKWGLPGRRAPKWGLRQDKKDSPAREESFASQKKKFGASGEGSDTSNEASSSLAQTPPTGGVYNPHFRGVVETHGAPIVPRSGISVVEWDTGKFPLICDCCEQYDCNVKEPGADDEAGGSHSYSKEQMYGYSERMQGEHIYVGWSRMNEIAKTIARRNKLDVRLGCRVGSIRRVMLPERSRTRSAGESDEPPVPVGCQSISRGTTGSNGKGRVVRLPADAEVQISKEFSAGDPDDELPPRPNSIGSPTFSADYLQNCQSGAAISGNSVESGRLQMPESGSSVGWELMQCEHSRQPCDPKHNPPSTRISDSAYDYVAVTLPGPQTLNLVSHMPIVKKFPTIKQRAKMRGCFVLMLGFSIPECWRSVSIPSAIDCKDHPVLRCVIVDSNKPGRSQTNRIGARTLSVCVYAMYKWSEQHFQMEETVNDMQDYRHENVLIPLLNEAKALLLNTRVSQHPTVDPLSSQRPAVEFWQYMFDMKRLEYTDLHAWRYVEVVGEKKHISFSPDSAFFDNEKNLGLAGDWCAGCATVEGAFASAESLADQIQADITRNTLLSYSLQRDASYAR
ncbi:unnamed protein product [Amoebophrya sp. A25]|nr:unnamed protein product [Amoebophrya sp. A25]|eukprot:GSA25T00023209001.1